MLKNVQSLTNTGHAEMITMLGKTKSAVQYLLKIKASEKTNNFYKKL